MLWKGREYWLGVEVNKYAVRVVQILRQKDMWCWLASASAPITNDTEQALQQALAQLPVARKQCVVASLPAEAVIRLSLEADADMSDTEMAEWLRQEAGQRMGIAPDILALDFMRPEANDGRVFLPVLASRCEQVLALEKQLNNSGLHVMAIEGEAQAIQRVCCLAGIQTAALLILEPQRAVLHFFQDGVVQQSHVLPDEAVMQVDTLAGHVQRAWQFMQATGIYVPCLYISAISLDETLVAQLQMLLGVPCSGITLLPRYADSVPNIAAVAPFFVALGLALWGYHDEYL